jgi:hypothetical protein
MFDNAQDSNFHACAQMVESVLQSRGLNPESCRIENEDGPAWGLQQGSAEVYIFLSSGDDGENYMQVVAPVMKPAADTVAQLMQRLLELNAEELTGAAFGLRGTEIVITSDRSTTGLDPVEVEEMLKRVGAYADYYDDILTVEYGGTRHADS